MIEKNYKAVYSKSLSNQFDQRFVIVQLDTGEVLDDAQVYGYKSKPKAYKAYAYKRKQRKKDSKKSVQRSKYMKLPKVPNNR